MSPSSDDTDVPRSFDDRAADALLRGHAPDEPALTAFLAEVRALADGPVPQPAPALAALLEAGIPAEDLIAAPLPRPARAVSWRVGGWALPLQLGLAAAACFALVLGAAAADTLPDPAQTAVADVVEAVTPLHLPRPHPADADEPVPAVSPTPTPAVPVTPTPERRTPAPAATVERTPEDRSSHDTGDGSDGGDRTTVRPDSHDSEGGDQQRQATPRPTAEPRDEPSDRSGAGDQPSDSHDDGLHPPSDDAVGAQEG